MMGTIAGLLLAVAASTQDQDLASELVERGWIDLAEDLCGKAGSPLGADPYMQGLIASAKAREEVRVERAVLDLNVAIERFGKVGRELSSRERSLLGSLRVQKARLLSESPEGPQAWQEAEAYYRAGIAAFAKRAPSPDGDELLLEFRLELPRVLIARAESISAESPRKALLEEAVRLLQDFQLDTGAMPVAFEALLEEGRARVEMKDDAKAERCFRAVLNLKKGGQALKGYPAMLWDAAFTNLVRSLTRSGRAKEAAALCDRFLRDEPKRARSAMGKAVLLSQAEARHAAGDEAGAILLAQKVVGLDPEGPAGRAARDRIREWMKSGIATPDRVLLVVEGLIEQGRYRDALVDLRRCVEICSGAAERAKVEPVTAFKRGECFRALKQEAEASVAFTDVFRKYPKHDLASRAAFEAVRSLSHVALSTRDPRDQERQEQMLQEVLRLDLRGLHGPVLAFIQAEILERKGQWKAAADLYRQVEPGSELHDEALVNAAHGYRRDAELKGSKGGEEAAAELKLAEELLRRALAHLELSADSRLRTSAEFEMASVCLSGAVQKPGDALTFLDRCSGRFSPDHDIQARLGEMAVRAQVALEDLPAAVERLSRLEKAFPDSPSTARSARRIALKQEASDPAAALKSYRVWLDRTETSGAATGELQSVADALVRIARTLNRFEDGVISVVDLRGKPVPDSRPWKEAARALSRLDAATDLPAKDRAAVESRLAWSLGLSAGSAADWDRLKRHCDGLIAKYKLMAPAGGLSAPALQSNRWMVGIVLEYGHALQQLGRAGQKYQYGNALSMLNSLLPMTQAGTEPWWVAKELALRTLFERGEADDIRSTSAALSSLERNYPEFDGGKYGLSEPLRRLKEQLKALEGPQR
jgi:hypothetical protein